MPMIIHHHSAKASGWSWSPTAGKAPRVSGQTTATINEHNGVLLFGGLMGAAGSPTTNDLWHFDSVENAWAQLLSNEEDGDGVSMSCPRVRMYAASASIGTKFYIFGGWDPMDPGSGGEFLDDIWSFDWTAKSWSEEKAKLPYPVSRHAAVTVNDDMAIIHTYKGILTFKDGMLSEQTTEGDAPDSLSMCAMTSIGDKVILFGGSDKKQQMSSEVYVLDTTNWTWAKLTCEKEGPTAMASPCMASLSKDQCIVFGGAGLAPTGYEGGYGLVPSDETWICTFDESNVQWERLECAKRPEARIAASLNSLGDGRFLMQGGYDPTTKSTFEEPWTLSKE